MGAVSGAVGHAAGEFGDFDDDRWFAVASLRHRLANFLAPSRGRNFQEGMMPHFLVGFGGNSRMKAQDTSAVWLLS